MRASNESSGEIKWRASEGGLQSVQHAEALFSGGVDIGADGAKALSAAEGMKAAGDSLFDFRHTNRTLCQVVCARRRTMARTNDKNLILFEPVTGPLPKSQAGKRFQDRNRYPKLVSKKKRMRCSMKHDPW
jgi:hypothetical protein